jgi:purine catabolism regulator
LLLGGLLVGHGDTDEELLAAALDRSPEFFALEALRTREGTSVPALERRALLRRLRDGAGGGVEELAQHVPAARTRADTPWVGLAVDGATEQAALGVVDLLTRRAGVSTLAAELDGVVVALVAGSPGLGRDELATRLASAAPVSGPRLAVGPVVGAEAAGRSLRAACQALALPVACWSGLRLVRAADLVVERVLAEVPDPLPLADLVEEQLGELLCGPGGPTLVRTLEEYLASGCSKAATARALHLRRQSVHQRLGRINALLGYDVTTPDRQAALRLAFAARALLAARPALAE